MLAENIEEGGAGEGADTGDQLVEDHPEAVEIGAGIDRLPHSLFRRHVGDRADDLPAARLLGAVGAPDEPEIHHLDPLLGRHEDVLRL